MNEHIIEYLDYYIELQNPQYGVMLKGNWGCGKTFFIKNQIERWNEKFIPDKTDKGNTIYLKPIYISLNGVSKISTINQKIRAEINPFLYSKGMKVAKNIAKGLLKTGLRINLDFDGNDTNEGSASFSPDSIGLFKSNEDIVKGKRIIIFDDLERCNIEIDEVFGYINEFVEHYGCKVILLTDEEKIKLKYRSENSIISSNEKKEGYLPIEYKDFKEKLIGQTFEVQGDIENVISDFIEDYKKQYDNDVLSDNKSLIIDIFNTSKLENLRVLKQGLLDFGRFIKNIDKNYKKHENYKDFIKQLLCYFIIVHIEYRTGNETIKNFDEIIRFKDKLKNTATKGKYRALFNEYTIHRSSLAFPVPDLFNYISRGYINPEVINVFLSENTFFRKDKKQSWEDLCRWKLLDDKIFKTHLKDVQQKFYKGKIEDPRVVLHISGILLDLIDHHLINIKKSYVEKKAKAILKKITKGDKALSLNIVFKNYSSSLNKRYLAYNTSEFQELKKYYTSLYNKQVSRLSKDYIKNVFEQITADTVDSIYDQLNESTPDNTKIYNQTSFLTQLDAKILARKIKGFHPLGINDFGFLIRKRYEYDNNPQFKREIESYHIEELDFIKTLKIELSKNHKKREPIKNMMLRDLDDIFKDVISLLENDNL